MDIWKDKKRNCLGLPWTFTTYKLSQNYLNIKKGFFNIEDKEIFLNSIVEVRYKQNLFQRFFNLGDIFIERAYFLGVEDGTIVLKNVANVKKVRDKIAYYVAVNKKNETKERL